MSLAALAAAIVIFPNDAMGQKNGMPDLARWVNPMIGTAKMGHVFPGACYPFGGVQLSPDTDTVPHNIDGVYQPKAYEYCAGYQYSDSTVVGFSHTHFSGTGHSDLGDVLIMPVRRKILTAVTGRAFHMKTRLRARVIMRLFLTITESGQDLQPRRGRVFTTILIQRMLPSRE